MEIQWKKTSLVNKWYWDNWVSAYKKMKLDPFLMPYKKLTKIMDLYVKAKAIKLLEKEIIGKPS